MSDPNPTPNTTVRVSLSSIAKMIDHALLHPTMTDAAIALGLELCRAYGVATACVKPYCVPAAVDALRGSEVRVCPVVGFPAGNSTIAAKVFEAREAVRAGASEVDVVVNVGKVLSGDWDYVANELRQVNEAVIEVGAMLKVIFETDYLEKDEGAIVRLCEICSELRIAFVKTSTGFGFVQGTDGRYAYKGATAHHLALMRRSVSNGTQIKASGGVRTLDDVLRCIGLGVTRIGTSSTVAILDEAKKRGIGQEEQDVPVPRAESPRKAGQTSGY